MKSYLKESPFLYSEMLETDLVDNAFRLTLLSVGTVIRKTDLQSVHGGENRYEPIC